MILRLDQDFSPDLREAMGRFEESFTYPMGPGMRFSISHGADYCRFYRSMGAGASACFVARRDSAVLGTVSVAVRTVVIEGVSRPSAYVGDLKLLPEGRNGFTLLRLAAAAEAWVKAENTAVESAFAVVMDGTEFTPDVYTGRAGIPSLAAVGNISVFCVNLTGVVGDTAAPLQAADGRNFAETFAALSRGFRLVEGGDAAARSLMVPLAVVAEGGAACATLEDTYEAKKLMLSGGGFLKAAHLVQFAFASPQAGLNLLRTAMGEAARRGYECLFFAVDVSLASIFTAELGRSLNGTVGGATIFASEKLEAGLSSSAPWIISTSEI